MYLVRIYFHNFERSLDLASDFPSVEISSVLNRKYVMANDNDRLIEWQLAIIDAFTRSFDAEVHFPQHNAHSLYDVDIAMKLSSIWLFVSILPAAELSHQ